MSVLAGISVLRGMFGFSFDADGLVRNIARAPFYAVVDGNVAGRTQRLVIIGRNAQRRSQFLIKSPQVGKLIHANRNLMVVMRQQKLLVARIPEARELPLI